MSHLKINRMKEFKYRFRDGVHCPSLFLFLLSAFSIIIESAAQSPRMEYGADIFPDNNRDRFEALIDSAELYSRNKRWKDAETATIEALRITPASPSNWLLWANLGEIRTQKDDLDGAVEAYSIGLNRNPKSMRMLEGRASALIQLGRESEAGQDLESALQLDSLRVWPRIMRAMIYMSKGEYEKAKKDYTTLLVFHPGNAEAYLGLARIYAAEGKEIEAITAFQKSILHDPDEMTYMYYIAFLADQGKLSEAAEELRVAMNKYPRRGNFFLLRAYLHKLSYRNEEAEIDRKLALEYGADKELIETVLDKFKR